MTRIQERDPILFPSEANENKEQKKNLGKGVVLVLAGIGVLAFTIYMTMIVFMTTQS